MTGLPHAHPMDEPQPAPDSGARDMAAVGFGGTVIVVLFFLTSLDVSNPSHRLVIAAAVVAGVVGIVALIALHLVGPNPFADEDR